jgi:hypothetical protein
LQVTLCLFSLGRTTQKHPEYTGPMIGPKMATENKRNFTEEQILQGRNAQIGLQAGSNKGASQVYKLYRLYERTSNPQSRKSAKLFLKSSELGLPQPLTRRRVCPPPRFWGESPNADEGTYTVVLFIYMYFVE